MYTTPDIVHAVLLDTAETIPHAVQHPDDLKPPPEPLEPPQLPNDAAAFTGLFRRYHAPLTRYARRITGDATAAADVLQDVFLKLWEDRTVITVRASLQALLYTMVRNQAFKANRYTKRIAADVDVAQVYERRASVPASDARLDTEELRRHLHRWIGELPPRRAEAFTLSRYHNLSYNEIAAIMGVSERTVETHILLALRELRRRLNELQTENPAPR